ncbi:hypothetical protein FACS189421_03150 [Bacteroidia bacterium]|nr:hypothetical protein FACS189421_03150 [Bacteroidia bacterium]
MTRKLQLTHSGKIDLGGTTISCAVLEDGRRVLVDRSVALALGKKGGGAYWQAKKDGKDLEGRAFLPEYISATYLQPYISSDLRAKLQNPIVYSNKKGEEFVSIAADCLPLICDAWITARDEGGLTLAQARTAEKAYQLMKAFSIIGITALVDEATGYQEVRDKKALQDLLDSLLLPTASKWAKTFPDNFWKEMFRLRRWEWQGMKINRPSVVGKYVTDIVYSRLAPQILLELENRNPRTNGYRKSKHHQFFTPDLGHPALTQRISTLIAFMQAASNWEDFMRSVNRAFPKQPQIPDLFSYKDFDKSVNTTSNRISG